MSIEADLYSHLSNDATLTGLVGARIYPQLMPDGCEKPAVTFTVVNEKELQALNSREPYGFAFRVQVDCWDTDFDQCLAVKEAVRTALHGFKHKAHGLNSLPGYEPDTKLFRRRIEFYLKG